jgi:hypothetical protein
MPDVAAPTRTLPHNLEAERSVLGAILIHNDAFNHAAELIDSRDFFRDAHRRIFDKMVVLSERGDADRLRHAEGGAVPRAKELDEVGGPAYIAALADGVPRSANVEYYARIVKEKSTLRNLIFSANKILADAYEAEEPRSCSTRPSGDLRDRRGRIREGSSRCATSCRAASRRSRSCSSTRGRHRRPDRLRRPRRDDLRLPARAT